MTVPSIRRAGVTVLVFTISAKVVGLLREVVVAANYGTTQTVDIYLAAITVPAIISTVLYHALPDAFVPLFAGGRTVQREGVRHAWWLLGIVAALAGGLWIMAIPAAGLTSAGFDAAQREEVVVVLRIAAMAVAWAAVEALARSRLLAQKRFVQSGISGLWTSLAMIVAVTLFPSGGTRTLVWGFAIGVAASAAWNLLPSRSTQSQADEAESEVSPQSDVPSNGLWIVTIILISSSGLLYTLIDRHFASFLPEGSIAALHYASLIASPAVAVCGLALGTTILPYLTGTLRAADHQATGQILDRAVRWSLLGAVPAAVWLMGLGDEIVTILLERGAFDSGSRIETGRLLPFYGLWAIPAVVVPVVAKVFYAARRWRPVFWATLAALGVKVVCSLFWVDLLGTVGLAGATAAAFAAFLIVLISALPVWCLSDHWLGWIRHMLVLVAIFGAGWMIAAGIVTLLPDLSWSVESLLRVALTGTSGVGLLLTLGGRLGIGEVSRGIEWVRESVFPGR